ncbi:hypothetical protein CC2G_014899 [Coprinopsis cinerea AmutBmut pab1-1]|nr:hypothetical protein CC2G_014899 [Coprinopsis cinerea AmutBmut pab1-1]
MQPCVSSKGTNYSAKRAPGYCRASGCSGLNAAPRGQLHAITGCGDIRNLISENCTGLLQSSWSSSSTTSSSSSKMGKVHGSLARAGKVKSQTPKVEPQEKKKTPKGRAKKRLLYNRRFVNVTTLPGGKRRMNPNPEK